MPGMALALGYRRNLIIGTYTVFRKPRIRTLARRAFRSCASAPQTTQQPTTACAGSSAEQRKRRRSHRRRTSPRSRAASMAGSRCWRTRWAAIPPSAFVCWPPGPPSHHHQRLPGSAYPLRSTRPSDAAPWACVRGPDPGAGPEADSPEAQHYQVPRRHAAALQEAGPAGPLTQRPRAASRSLARARPRA